MNHKDTIIAQTGDKEALEACGRDFRVAAVEQQLLIEQSQPGDRVFVLQDIPFLGTLTISAEPRHLQQVMELAGKYGIADRLGSQMACRQHLDLLAQGTLSSVNWEWSYLAFFHARDLSGHVSLSTWLQEQSSKASSS